MVSPDCHSIPEFLHNLFWEYDPGQIDIDQFRDLIMYRIMERGSWDAMKWLQNRFSKKQLAHFLENRGRRVLPPRELCYWALVTGVPAENRISWVKNARERDHVWDKRVSP